MMKRLTKFQEKQLAYLNEHKGIAPSNGQRWWGRNVLSGCWKAFEENGYTTRENNRTVLTELGLAYLAKYKPDWKELLLETQELGEYDKAQLVYAYQNEGKINWRCGSYQVHCTYKRLRAHKLINPSYGGSKIYLSRLGCRYAGFIQNEVNLSVLAGS